MSGRIQYLLIVLLFVLTGNLAHHQTAVQSADHAGNAVFMQNAIPQNHVAFSLIGHTFYAPEAMNDSQSEIFSYKAPATTDLLPGYLRGTMRTTAGFPHIEVIDPHPKDYYIFSLEKILI